MEVMKKMAKIVDDQNKNDPSYQRMSDNFDKSLAFSAACDLVFKGRQQPSGYTEPLLHQKRLERKSFRLTASNRHTILKCGKQGSVI